MLSAIRAIFGTYNPIQYNNGYCIDIEYVTSVIIFCIILWFILKIIIRTFYG